MGLCTSYGVVCVCVRAVYTGREGGEERVEEKIDLDIPIFGQCDDSTRLLRW